MLNSFCFCKADIPDYLLSQDEDLSFMFDDEGATPVKSYGDLPYQFSSCGMMIIPALLFTISWLIVTDLLVYVCQLSLSVDSATYTQICLRVLIQMYIVDNWFGALCSTLCFC